MSENNTKSPLWRAASTTYKSARRIAVTVVGASVVLIGVAMLVLPGPALVVIPIGLAILGVEFAWARRWLENIKAGTEKGLNSLGIVIGAASAAPPSADATVGPARATAQLRAGEKVANVPEKDL